MMKRFWAVLLMVCLLPVAGLCEQVVFNRTENLTEEFVFPEGTPVLEIVFPRVYSSDCAIIRFGNETMMIDASTKNIRMRTRIQSALASMGVDHIDVAYNSHPHDDHIDGFSFVDAYCPIGKLLIAFDENFDGRMREAVAYCNAQNIPIQHVADGDVLTMGPNGEVTMRVIQRLGTKAWTTNDRSAMLLIQYGERTILFSGDVENRAQQSYGDNLPEGGLKADILKYPHHGQVKLKDKFLEAIAPELAFMNAGRSATENTRKYLQKKGIPSIIGYDGLTRMRTDGTIWVVDYMHEENPDREAINPEYTSTTNVP